MSFMESEQIRVQSETRFSLLWVMLGFGYQIVNESVYFQSGNMKAKKKIACYLKNLTPKGI